MKMFHYAPNPGWDDIVSNCDSHSIESFFYVNEASLLIIVASNKYCTIFTVLADNRK